MKQKNRVLYLLALLTPNLPEAKELEMCLPESLKDWKKKKGIEVAEDNPESKCDDRKVEKIEPDASNGTESTGTDSEGTPHFEMEMPEKKLEPGTALRLREPVSETTDPGLFRSSKKNDRIYWDDLDKELKKDKLLSKFPRVCITYKVWNFANFNQMLLRGQLQVNLIHLFKLPRKSLLKNIF